MRSRTTKNLSRPELIKVIRSGDTQNRDWKVARNILDRTSINYGG
ncbi:MAG TPA: hypothetical protein DCS91_01255 [Microcoleaceae bacterium UBA11344]|nr:hypothetical protein [Microcoleaceae cyanobacterium UBA11344]